MTHTPDAAGLDRDERAARIAALEEQLVRTVEGHIDSLDGATAATIACSAILSAAVSIVLRSTNFDVDKALAILRNAPWGELLLAEYEALREAGELP